MHISFDTGQLFIIAESALLVSLALGVFLHEAGHAVAAWLLGLDLRTVSLGQGPAMFHARLRGVLFVLHGIPFSGFVAIAAKPGMSRSRYAAMIAAGPGVNAVLLLMAACAGQLWPDYSTVFLAFGAAQAIILVLTLAPLRTRARGAMRPSDGAQLWRQLVHKPADLFGTQYAALLKLVVADGQALPAPSPNAPELVYQIVRSDRLGDDWAARDARAAIRRLLGPWQLNPMERVLALDFLVSEELLLGDTGISDVELDRWSTETLALAPSPATTLTRGGVLAVTGRGAQAAALLEPLASQFTLAIYRFCWNLYLARALAAQGLGEAADPLLASAREIATTKAAASGLLMDILARAQRTAPLAALARRAAPW